MRIVDMVCNDEWIKDYEFFNEFKDTNYFDILLDTCENLNTDILFKSNVHGQDPYRRETPKIGRNEPCPCGSGKKYKKCCRDKDLAAERGQQTN